MNRFRIEGMLKLQQDLKKLGNTPQRHVTSSSRKGMNVVLKGAKAKAPDDKGNLKKGMKLVGEKSKTKAKKVYRVAFNSAMNNVFQKKNAEGKVTGYYPISQEYGYFTRDGKYMRGFRFIHRSLADNAQKTSKVIVDTMKMKIDQEITKLGLK